MRVPRNVMEQLRPLGFHDGYSREASLDVDPRLLMAFHPRMTLQGRSKHLGSWLNYVERECCAKRNGFPTIWNPQITKADGVWLKKFYSNLVEIDASNVEQALHQFNLTKWNFGVIYHVACMGDWETVVSSQLTLLHNVGINGVYISLLGSHSNKSKFLKLARNERVEVDIKFYSENLKLYEIPAIRLVEDWARSHPSGYFLYFHSKGVSIPGDYIKNRWRKLMEKWVIGRWKQNCDLLLSGYDAVGVSWRAKEPIAHFPGNFFMAKSSLVTHLQEFENFYINPHHRIADAQSWRFQAEFWIGSGKKDIKVFSHVALDQPPDKICQILVI